jgi:hypothetical protein
MRMLISSLDEGLRRLVYTADEGTKRSSRTDAGLGRLLFLVDERMRRLFS